jgi:hypothetical protein
MMITDVMWCLNIVSCMVWYLNSDFVLNINVSLVLWYLNISRVFWYLNISCVTWYLKIPHVLWYLNISLVLLYST